jgi:hypothetical protein
MNTATLPLLKRLKYRRERGLTLTEQEARALPYIDTGLSTRAVWALLGAGYKTPKEAQEVDLVDFANEPNVGLTTLLELQNWLGRHGKPVELSLLKGVERLRVEAARLGYRLVPIDGESE